MDICASWPAVSPEFEAPKNIFPAVPVAPAVPDHPVIASVFPLVQPTALLAAKYKEWAPVPNESAVFSVKFKLPILVEEVPIVFPVDEPELNVPPFKTTPPPVLATAIAFAAFNVNVPAFRVVEPVYVLANEKVKLPAPFLITEPAPEIAAVEKVVLPVPSMVKFLEAAVTTPPVRVKDVPDDLISAEVPSVMGRAKEGDPVDV